MIQCYELSTRNANNLMRELALKEKKGKHRSENFVSDVYKKKRT